MLIALPLALGVVAALVWRQSRPGQGRRELAAVAALALGARFVAALVITIIAHQSHWTDVWLSDEASFFLATESLLPDPLGSALPQGLEHLGGDGYLGLTTVVAMAGRVADAHTFRVINAALGTCVVLLSVLTARRMFGPRAGLITGLGLAVWPTLILWSATMLRDTLGGFAVVMAWWTLGRARELGWLRTVGALALTLVIAGSLRAYLAGAMVAGVGCWAAYPYLRQLRPRMLALLGAAVIVAGITVGVAREKEIDFAMHALLYRQTVTRVESLGRLYSDQPPSTVDLPMKPGTAVGLVQPGTGWILGGVLQGFDTPDVARVAFADESVRAVPFSELIPLESTKIPPLQLVAWFVPNLYTYLVGISPTSEPSNPAWIAIGLAWDALLVLAVMGCVRARLSPREWLFPLCVVVFTVLALIAVPGAPGNADRHRATQTLPLLLVLASGLISASAVSRRTAGLAVSTSSTRPPSEPAASSSRIRSAR